MKLVTQNERIFLDNSVNSGTLVLAPGGIVYADSIQPATSGGAVTVGTKVVGNVTTATATSDGLTTGLLASANQFVTVTSASATNIVTLPAVSTVTTGTEIQGYIGANGFKLQVAVANATTITLNGVTTNVKAAIPANVYFKVQLVSATQWILTTLTALGAVGTAIVPA